MLAVAANELIHCIDQGIEVGFSIRVKFPEFLKAGIHPLGQNDFGLRNAADEVGNCGKRRFQFGKPPLVSSELLGVLFGRSL